MQFGSLFCAAALASLPTSLLAGTFGDISTMSRQFPKRAVAESRGEILVKFKDGVTRAARDARHAQFGAVKVRELRRSGVHQVRIPPSQSVEQAVARYRADSSVQYAEPNYLMRSMRVPNETTGLNLLWGLRNTGQTLGTPGADIKATQAWDLTVGSPEVAVMVIDSGVDTSHFDLAANIWVNDREIPGNGIDDDGNGYIDDVHGIDVINGDADPADDYGHGTHVAGTIGAVGDNAAGVVGVNWAVKIIPCKMLDANGNGTVADAVACLDYASALKARGVNIVATNNSYGGPGAYSQTLYEAIKTQRDILFVAAAGNTSPGGNDNDATPFYPASFDLPSVLSIAATDHHDLMPEFSHYGRRTVHLGAPGANITSTTPFNNFMSANGTSMAAPHATGVAALLKSQDGTRDWRRIKNLILAGGAPKASMAGKTVTGHRLDAFGSATCSNRPLFSVLKMPAAFTVGVPATVSVLSINCDAPAGPVTLTPSAGAAVELLDDGVAPDVAAGDGIFTAAWTPTVAFTSMAFASPAGAEDVGMLDLTLGGVNGPASANRGDTVTLSATVSNPGAMAAPASTVDLFLSVDGVITASDLRLASVATPPLAAGAQAVVSVPVTIPTTVNTATYFLGAIVDPANLLDEGNELNNARAGSTIAVGNLPVDLAVPALTAPASAFVGDMLAVSATVANLGTSASAASALNFYISSDQVINGADLLVATAPVGALAGGASQVVSGSLQLPASLPPGTYYVGAVVDPGNAILETNETNNNRVSAAVTATVRAIDLGVTATTGPSAARDQQPVTLGATVRNLGSVTAPASTLRWYLSTDNVITADDIPVASAAVPSVAGGGTATVSTTAVIPGSVPAGNYVLGAIADPDNALAETDDGNNAAAGGTVAVSYSVDVTLDAVAGPTSTFTGKRTSFTGTVRNQGLAATPGSVTVAFYASADASITSNDTLVASTTVPAIAAGASVAVTASGALPTTLKEGTYYIGAIVDPGSAIAESVESNNARTGNTTALAYGPDLVMTTVAGPSVADRGTSITLTGTVLNQGVGAVGVLSDQNFEASASVVRVAFYLSSDTTITANDIMVVAVPTPSVGPGRSVDVSVRVTLPPNAKPGIYTLGAVADFSNGVRESDELNNALAGALIEIR